MPHAPAVDVDKLERAAAEVADHAVRPVHAGDDAERGQFRLALAGEHVDLRPAHALGELDEAAPFSASRQAAVAMASPSSRPSCRRARGNVERGERLLDGLGGEQSGRLHFAAEAGSTFSLKIGVGARVSPS